jgi:hypothetical protein
VRSLAVHPGKWVAQSPGVHRQVCKYELGIFFNTLPQIRVGIPVYHVYYKFRCSLDGAVAIYTTVGFSGFRCSIHYTMVDRDSSLKCHQTPDDGVN